MEELAAQFNKITDAEVTQFEKQVAEIEAKRNDAIKKRRAEIEEYMIADARFSFRDSYQPPLALAYDPQGLLATAEYTLYSALHIAQNFEADWFEPEDPEYHEIAERAGISQEGRLAICCAIRKERRQRLHLLFQLNDIPLLKRAWEERYCYKLSATDGFQLKSQEGPVPDKLNRLFQKDFLTFYAVPAVGPAALTLKAISKTTALFLSNLHINFDEEGEQEYLMVIGSAALLVSYEQRLAKAGYLTQKDDARGKHIFDWDLLC